MKFFSYDSKFSQIVLAGCQACLLNLLWVICSLPVFTIGASTTALYYVCIKIVLTFIFPLTAIVSNTTKAMFKNAFLIGTHYLFATIMVFAVHFAVFFVTVRFFTPLIIFGEGLCAMISASLLNNVLAACSYDPENAPEEEDPDGSQ